MPVEEVREQQGDDQYKLQVESSGVNLCMTLHSTLWCETLGSWIWTMNMHDRSLQHSLCLWCKKLGSWICEMDDAFSAPYDFCPTLSHFLWCQTLAS